MKWIETKTQLPPVGVNVLGLGLNRYVNADWTWSGGFITRLHQRPDGTKFWDSKYIAPEMWCLIEYPPVPDHADRERAKAVGARESARKAAIEQAARDFDAAVPLSEGWVIPQ